MPNVGPSVSSTPPLSGDVEDDPKHLQNHNHTVLLPTSGQQNISDSTDLVENLSTCHETTISSDAQSSSHERSREEVIKEIAISSTAFIGPACRQDVAIEKELSDFYKELEEIDHQDSTDGDTRVTEEFRQTSAPEINPSTRKKVRETYNKNAYRPYPAARPQRDNGNNRRWNPRPHNDMTWNESNSYNHQNQLLPPSLPQGPPRFQFHGQQDFLHPPPPGNPMHPPYFQPQLNDYRHADNSSWPSWERPPLPFGYDGQLSSSNCPGSFEPHGRNSDWQPHEIQNCHVQNEYPQNKGTSLVLILMRGVPGCGKSTLAKQILSTGPNGLILSTDDYFFQKNGGFFDPTLLGNAHDWNHKRARDAMLDGRSPVIIDNTNVQAWEMKPYVALALECGYRVDFVEPDTRWKCDPTELEKRNKHGVPRETIEKMLDRFELPISVDIVMNSCKPPHKRKEHPPRPRFNENF